MAIESLRLDGWDVSVKVFDEEDSVGTKPVFLPCRGRIENNSNSPSEGKRTLTLGRGFVKSIANIYQRYKNGKLSKDDVRIIMDTFAHFGNISMCLLDFPENNGNDSVHNQEIPSSKLNKTHINSDALRRPSPNKFIERANRKKKENSISRKAVRVSTRLKTRTKNKHRQSEKKSDTIEPRRRMMRNKRMRSKEVICKEKNGNKSMKQKGDQKVNPTIKLKRISEHKRIKLSGFCTHKSILRKYLKMCRPFKCTECGKTFKRKYHLKIHQLIHAQERPHSCNQCGKKFTQSSNLNTHLKTHSKIQPHECEICGKLFSRKGNLQRHRRMHTNEKPYKCKDCGKRFSDLGNLNKHHKVHSNERPYLCHQCGKAFKRTNNLEVHLRTHKQEYLYSCKDCGKKFKQSSNLKQHQMIHANERPNKCQICGKTFTHSGNLHKHIKIHRKEKLHSCFVCKKTFAEKGNLKTHLKVHTNERRCQHETRSSGNKHRGT
ncbi:zinc finger protein 660-like isoform X1 [Ptychodera flava]|uniref:zinc finger protein 660-like isoform X1 n=2 Tax=Ptychodera flava TaxID=63121 RepID=UPI00396AA6C0